MYREETALRLIGLIYDAAADPSRWPVFLEEFAGTMSGTVTSLVLQKPQSQTGQICATVRIDPAEGRKYDEHYVQHDPWRNFGSGLHTPGSIRLSSEMCPDELLKNTEFYNDFLRYLDAFHAIAGFPVAHKGTISVVSTFRPASADPFSEEEARFFRVLLPHLQRAIQIHLKIGELNLKSQTAESAANRLHIGLIRLDHDGRVLSMNRAAEKIVAQCDGLTVTVAGVQAARPEETRRLRILISEAGLRGEGIGFASGGALAVSRPSLKRSFSVLVSPAPTSSLPFAGPRAAAVLFITDPDAEVESNEEVLQQLFGLTASEARIVALLARGCDLNEICDDLSIRRTTARTHVRHVFDKMGVRRQSELVSLVLRTFAAIRITSSPE